MDDSTAKKKIDSIKPCWIRDKNLTVSLFICQKTKKPDKGRRPGIFWTGPDVKEFGDFTFNGKKGEIKIVKTQFGYHLIEIMIRRILNRHQNRLFFPSY